jgi:UDP-N-acetylmuramate dehydrogenase
MKISRNEPLKKHTSFRLGGAAEYFCQPKSVSELKEALEFAKGKKLAVFILGSGTNLLILDCGFKGLVIKIAGGLNKLAVKNNQVKVGAGWPLPKLLQKLATLNLGGVEFLSGIPGSVGGAVVMNAGAWGKEIGDYVEEIVVVNQSGEEERLSNKRLKFGYRQSWLQGKDLIVTEIVLKLKKKKGSFIKEAMAKYLALRYAGQPLGAPNCGSVFKNPKGEYAGRLIEAAGCKGWRVGDAQVSSKHANFIVNLGEAKASQVIKLIARIQQAVKKRFHIILEPELKIMVKSA